MVRRTAGSDLDLWAELVGRSVRLAALRAGPGGTFLLTRGLRTDAMSKRPLTAAVIVLGVTGCAASRPFSVSTPGLEALQQEEPYLYASPPQAIQALGGASLRGRIDNLVETYEQELTRAENAQGGFLNTALSVLGLILPISGTVSAVALSDPDQLQTVGIVAGAATTAVMGLNLLLKPQAKAAAAAECASFLGSALEAVRRRWDPSQLDSLLGTPQDWNSYLTMRATLEPSRVAACGS